MQFVRFQLFKPTNFREYCTTSNSTTPTNTNVTFITHNNQNLYKRKKNKEVAFKRVTFAPEQIKEIRELRSSDPWKYTVSTLAKLYNTNGRHISAIAPAPPSYIQDRIEKQILSMNPSKAWRGKTHYKRIKQLQSQLKESKERKPSTLVGTILHD